MPYKDKEKQKIAQREEYLRHKDRYKKRLKQRKRERIAWFIEYRKTLSCSKCQESDYRCIQFHHRDPTIKKNDVCKLVYAAYSRTTILAEISKCDILCANCHRLTYINENRIVSGQTKFIRECKMKSNCIKCGASGFSCLDFHHKDPENKVVNLSKMASNSCYSLQDIINEIEKCDILCANCHIKEHVEIK